MTATKQDVWSEVRRELDLRPWVLEAEVFDREQLPAGSLSSIRQRLALERLSDTVSVDDYRALLAGYDELYSATARIALLTPSPHVVIGFFDRVGEILSPGGLNLNLTFELLPALDPNGKRAFLIGFKYQSDDHFYLYAQALIAALEEIPV